MSITTVGCSAEDADATRSEDFSRRAKVDEPEPDETTDEERLDDFIENVPQGPVKRDPVISKQGDRAEQQQPKPEAGQLTAGRWSDVENWRFWLDLFDGQSDETSGENSNPHEWGQWESRWGVHTRRRAAIRVTGPDDAPAVDARVELRDDDGNLLWSARTDNRGRAEVFAGLFEPVRADSYRLEVSSGNHQRSVSLETLPDSGRKEIRLAGRAAPPPALDLMFVVDTTGSMGDELRYLQSELGDVVERTQQYFGRDLSIRTSVNVYRDADDDYVVRTNPFRRSPEQAVADLDAEKAGGGGDYPEAVDRALSRSIEEHEWSDRARARILFLVLDAPPHHREAVIEKLHDSLEVAARRGVRIVPVAGSGVNKSTEFVLRSMAIATGGTYTFLTDDSGIGGSHIEPTIGDHEVHYLNDLLVTVVHDYTKPIGGRRGTSAN